MLGNTYKNHHWCCWGGLFFYLLSFTISRGFLVLDKSPLAEIYFCLICCHWGKPKITA